MLYLRKRRQGSDYSLSRCCEKENSKTNCFERLKYLIAKQETER
jgi:hypothetical protein